MGKQKPSKPQLQVDEDGFRPLQKAFRWRTVPDNIRDAPIQEELLGCTSDQKQKGIVANVRANISVDQALVCSLRLLNILVYYPSFSVY